MKVALLAGFLTLAAPLATLAQAPASPVSAPLASTTEAAPRAQTVLALAPASPLPDLDAPLPPATAPALSATTLNQSARKGNGTSAITWVSLISGLLVSTLLVINAARK
ncbi:MAG TPA: hypothetical protein VEA44_11205 [Caulobacter sp.]|nr:hypothetical protein [Caulobacter sp.]